MNNKNLPYKQMLFVCTNSRKPGERISCAGEGRCGDAVLRKLKDYVKANGLEAQVRVAKSGCHEKCEAGPNIVVLPQNEMLTGVSEDDVAVIAERYLAPLKTA